MDELEEYVSNYHPDVAVLTVPQNVAQSLADRLIALGVRGFWNFTNVELSTDEPGVFFEDIHFVEHPPDPELPYLPPVRAHFPATGILWE